MGTNLRQACSVYRHNCLYSRLARRWKLLTLTHRSVKVCCVCRLELLFSIEGHACSAALWKIIISILIPLQGLSLNYRSRLRHYCLFASAKKGAHFALARVGKQLLNQGWSLEKPLLGTLHLSLFRFLTLYVDRFTSRLKETESAEEQVRVNKKSDDVVYLLNGYLLVDINGEKLRIAILKN